MSILKICGLELEVWDIEFKNGNIHFYNIITDKKSVRKMFNKNNKGVHPNVELIIDIDCDSNSPNEIIKLGTLMFYIFEIEYLIIPKEYIIRHIEGHSCGNYPASKLRKELGGTKIRKE